MLALLSAAIGAVSEGLKVLNTKEARKYIDRLVDLQLEIQKEESKGYHSDDAKIEALYKELKIVFEASKAEMALLAARSSGA